jgi:serine/threonine-protein kinase
MDVAESLIGRQLQQYRVTAVLGRGGMGVVYRARDVRLDRDVALKVLPAGGLRDGVRQERFLREARAASALTHPNIVTVHEIDAADGMDFIAMELVEGRTLAECIPPAGLDASLVLDWAKQVLDGMSAAHRAGLVHRDIKPRNIMIRPDGRLKILDFGLAKVRADAELETDIGLTAEGAVVGTVAYMSPEQARGDAVGAASDVFSIGVTLYEMVTGQRPFRGSEWSAMHALIEGIFEPVLQVRSDCPPVLARAITRALQPNVADRYPDAGAMLLDLFGPQKRESSERIDTAEMIATGLGKYHRPALDARTRRRWLVVAGPVAIALLVAAGLLYRARDRGPLVNSLAVLPFANDSGTPDLDYIADGLPDSVRRDFAGIAGLRVPPRSAIRGWDAARRDLRAAAVQSGVQAAFSGRVRRVDGTLSVDVQVVDQAGTSIWSRRYDNPGGLLQLEQDISRDVGRLLRVTPNTRARPPASTDAYELYLKGRHEIGLRAMDNLRRAILYLSQATTIDRQFAAAYAGIGEAYALIANFGSQPPVTALEQAKLASRRALDLDSTIPEAHMSYGFALAFGDHDWARAEQSLRRAIELNPELPDPHAYLAVVVLTPLKRFDEAMIEMQRAIELDPESSIRKLVQVHVLYTAHRYESALAALARVDPMFLPEEIAQERALNLEAMGRPADAAAAILAAVPDAATSWIDRPESLDESRLGVLGLLARAWASTGRAAMAERVLGQLERSSSQSYISGCTIAGIQAALHRDDAAMRQLRRCVAERDFQSLYIDVDARFDDLRHDAGFVDLVDAAGLRISSRP